MNIIKLSAVSLLAFNLAGCGEVIDTGNRGIETRYGKVVSESMEEGLYFYNPFTTSIIEMDAKTKKFEVTTSAYTKDVQQASMSVVVNYNLEKLFEAINHVELDINKPIMQMEEEEIQQLGHCFFVAFDSPFDVTPGSIPPEEDLPF